jgi:glutathione S-transferase
MAIAAAGLEVEIREVALRNKPEQLLVASPKGTVPVLITGEGKVIEESFDIMRWALQQNDPFGWLSRYPQVEMERLVEENDGPFKHWLDRYKYADRYPEHPPLFYRQKAEQFLQRLEVRLTEHPFLCGGQPSLADNALFPFIRQFSKVDGSWFETAPYPHLRDWLRSLMESARFRDVMTKRKPWQAGAEPIFWTGC